MRGLVARRESGSGPIAGAKPEGKARELDPSTPLKVFSTDWCPYCRILKRFLDERGIPYQELKIDSDADAMDEIMRLQNGGRTIPTVVYADGSHDVNPSGARVLEKLQAAA